MISFVCKQCRDGECCGPPHKDGDPVNTWCDCQHKKSVEPSDTGSPVVPVDNEH